jgi:hypothetical protein
MLLLCAAPVTGLPPAGHPQPASAGLPLQQQQQQQQQEQQQCIQLKDHSLDLLLQYTTGAVAAAVH